MALVALILLLCTCSGGGGSSGGGANQGGGGNPPEDDNLPSGELVQVHLARTLHSASQAASGFLASLSQDRPGDIVILALKPRLFRLNPQTRDLYPRVTGFAASAQMVPSYPYFKGPSATTDYETWAATWEAFLVSVVDEAVSLNQNWQWDIWNEPNWPTFWIGTKSQYFETWKRAHRIIRTRIPNAVIVGPSIAYYDESYLSEFLLYAQSNNVLPDALSWHELLADSPGAIESRVAAMRRFMTENAIPVSRIQLNEIGCPTAGTDYPAAVGRPALAPHRSIEAAARRTGIWFPNKGDCSGRPDC